jgi:hypothetical protein
MCGELVGRNGWEQRQICSLTGPIRRARAPSDWVDHPGYHAGRLPDYLQDMGRMVLATDLELI